MLSFLILPDGGLGFWARGGGQGAFYNDFGIKLLIMEGQRETTMMERDIESGMPEGFGD